MALMEQQLESIDSNLQRLSEAADFDQSLSAPDEAPAQIPVQSPSPRSNE